MPLLGREKVSAKVCRVSVLVFEENMTFITFHELRIQEYPFKIAAEIF